MNKNITCTPSRKFPSNCKTKFWIISAILGYTDCDYIWNNLDSYHWTTNFSSIGLRHPPSMDYHFPVGEEDHNIPFGLKVVLFSMLSCFISAEKEEKKFNGLIYFFFKFWIVENDFYFSCFFSRMQNKNKERRQVSDMLLAIYIDSFLLQFFLLILLFIKISTCGFNFNLLFHF